MTHLAHPSAFPTEIYERIIGWIGNLTQVWSLHAEKLSMEAYRIKLTTLYSCALTCRAWLPMSRVCLYHQPTFLSPNRIPFERLVQTLDAKPWLGNLINALAVIDNHKSTMDSKVSDRDCAGDISHTWPVILSGRISSLPRLCTLHVTLADGLARHPQYIRSMRTIGSAVTTLSLEWYHSGSFADLFRLISAFPNLRTLMLAGGLWAPNGTRTAISSRHLPPLSRLTITNSQPYKDGVWKEITYRMLQAAADSIAIIELDPACVPYFTSDVCRSPNNAPPPYALYSRRRQSMDIPAVSRRQLDVAFSTGPQTLRVGLCTFHAFQSRFPPKIGFRSRHHGVDE
ncbi:hypothetical protein GY45DRAFT_206594 [Cubamyces sp. BRFM 1775]|nr:hypothetical protein GY45DRAFT_206594 [Cubamyces sp. BRFM 1775]